MENPKITLPFVDHSRVRIDAPIQVVKTLLLEWRATPGAFQLPESGSEFVKDEVHRMHGAQSVLSFTAAGQVVAVIFSDFRGARHGASIHHVQVDGEWCASVTPKGWIAWADRLDALRYPVTIKRVDLAVDDDTGAIACMDDVRRIYASGAFDPLKGGKRPCFEHKGDDADGFTVYLGKRDTSPRYQRIYNKTAEALAKHGARAFGMVPMPPQPSRIRHEVELKPCDTVIIPTDVYRAPADFMRGVSRHWCGLVGQGQERSCLRVCKRVEDDVMVQLGHARRQYGTAVEAALHIYAGDLQAVISLLRCGDLDQVRARFPGLQALDGDTVDIAYRHSEERRVKAPYS